MSQRHQRDFEDAFNDMQQKQKNVANDFVQSYDKQAADMASQLNKMKNDFDLFVKETNDFDRHLKQEMFDPNKHHKEISDAVARSGREGCRQDVIMHIPLSEKCMTLLSTQNSN